MKGNSIFSIHTAEEFNASALELFHYQAIHCKVYNQYLHLLGKDPSIIQSIHEIPFLPVTAFRDHNVTTGSFSPEAIFTSSGTTGSKHARHLVKSLNRYRETFTHGFNQFYEAPDNWCILALLPSYLDREGSSLVYMCEKLMETSRHPFNGFYLRNQDILSQTIQELEDAGQPTILIGVTFALLEFAENFPRPLHHTMIMETGGMKGQRREMVREEVHSILQDAFMVSSIHSEYGMTELMSQAYSRGHGTFVCPPWMKVLARDPNDPLDYVNTGKSGALSIIDLANVDSCAFIATQDLGKVAADGSFEVLGRFDDADVRGCNLLVTG